MDLRKIAPSVRIQNYNNQFLEPFLQTKPLFYFDPNNSTSFSNGSVVNDLSGNERSATAYNSVTTSTTSKGAKFFSFNGSNQYLQLAAQDFGSFSSGITIIAFANFGSASNWERIIDFGSGPAASNIGFSREATSQTLLHFQYNGGTTTFQTGAANYIVNSSWKMYGVVANGSTIKYWSDLNNTSVSSSAVPIQTNRTINYIARSNWSADAYFELGIGQIAMWNTALSDAQITNIYNTHIGRYV